MSLFTFQLNREPTTRGTLQLEDTLIGDRLGGDCVTLGVLVPTGILSIGIDELSVSPRSVLPLRKKIRETDVSKVKDELMDDLMGEGKIF